MKDRLRTMSRFGVNLLNIAIGHPKIELFYRCPKVSTETMYWKSRLCHIHTQHTVPEWAESLKNVL